MATMGKRKIAGRRTPKKLVDKPFAEIGRMSPNLVTIPIHVQPVATQGYQPPILGIPIMREGFITGTGFLLHVSQSRTTFR